MCSQSGVHIDLILGWPLGGRERKSVAPPDNKLLPELQSGPGPHGWQILAASLSCCPCWQPPGDVLVNHHIWLTQCKKRFYSLVFSRGRFKRQLQGFLVVEKHELDFGARERLNSFGTSPNQELTGSSLSQKASKQAGVQTPTPPFLVMWPWSSQILYTYFLTGEVKIMTAHTLQCHQEDEVT